MQLADTKICVIGLGYIGLPTASLLGTKGYDVFGVDTSEHVVNTINQGKIHIVEPDLDKPGMAASPCRNPTAKADWTRLKFNFFPCFWKKAVPIKAAPIKIKRPLPILNSLANL